MLWLYLLGRYSGGADFLGWWFFGGSCSLRYTEVVVFCWHISTEGIQRRSSDGAWTTSAVSITTLPKWGFVCQRGCPATPGWSSSRERAEHLVLSVSSVTILCDWRLAISEPYYYPAKILVAHKYLSLVVGTVGSQSCPCSARFIELDSRKTNFCCGNVHIIRKLGVLTPLLTTILHLN